nr:uncharacterized protein LOC115492478 isoform X2 [Taeniopygia guttata]
MNPGSDVEHRPASVPKLAWGKEEKEGPGAAPAQQPEEVEQFQPPQKGAAVQRTREQERTRGRFRRTAQVPAAIPTWAGPAGTAQPSTVLGALHATSRASCPSATDGLQIHEEDSGGREQRHGHCGQSVLSHLQNQDQVLPCWICLWRRVLPAQSKAALAMWKSIMCSPRTAEPAMLVLLDVLGSWPEHSTCTSDGDHTAVLALAMVTVYFPRLFVHLLFQVLFSTLDMPEEVDTFWKGCQQQYGLASNPNRFAVRTLKSLLCQMQHEDVVVAMERKCGWDTLLCADTHHCAVGLLAREMSCVSIPLCSRIARYLLRLLSTQEPRWELPSLAFLVELSLKASAASLSCLPALCPLLAAVPGTVPAPCAAAWAQPCAVLGSCRPVPCHCPVPFRASSAWN